MPGEPARRHVTYEDVLNAPEHLVAELFDGDLYLSPRPAGPHAEASSVPGMELGGPFHRGRGGPGGWIILDEPELHFGTRRPRAGPRRVAPFSAARRARIGVHRTCARLGL